MNSTWISVIILILIVLIGVIALNFIFQYFWRYISGRRVKHIFELSKRDEKGLEESRNYWSNIFYVLSIPNLLIMFLIIKESLTYFGDYQVILDTKIYWLFLLLVLFGIATAKIENRDLAIYLKKKKCKSLMKARKLIKSYV